MVAKAEVVDAPGCGPGESGFESRQSPRMAGYPSGLRGLSAKQVCASSNLAPASY